MFLQHRGRMEYAGGATGRKHRRPLCQMHLYDAFAIQESRHVDAGNE